MSKGETGELRAAEGRGRFGCRGAEGGGRQWGWGAGLTGPSRWGSSSCYGGKTH